MKKRLLSALLVSVMSLSLLAGCGGQETEEAGEGGEGEGGGKITFMAPDWAIPTEDQLAAFTEETGIEVECSEVGWDDIREKIATAASANECAADVVEVDWSWVGEFYAADWLEPLEVSEEDKADMPTIETFTVDDQVLAMPYANDYRLSYYNTEQFAAAGITEEPQTWDEFYDAAVALTKDGVYGAAVSLSPNDLLGTRYLNYYVRSAGGSLLNDDLTANLTSPEAIEGIKFWIDVYKNCSPAETINYTVNDHATLYYQGITAFDFNSGFQIDGVRNNRPDLLPYVSCAMLPRMNADDPLYSAEATHIPLVVWQNSEHPEICEAFIEFLYEEDNYTDFLSAVPVGMLPSISGISETEAYRSNEIVQDFAEEEAIITQAIELGSAIGFEHGPSAQAGLLANQGIIEEMFQDIIMNGTPVEEAAAAAEAELNEIFETMVQ